MSGLLAGASIDVAIGDYEFEKRGTVFAPVAFADNRHFHDSYRYRPDYCIDTGAKLFRPSLFFGTTAASIIFGDYYEQQINNKPLPLLGKTARNLHDQYDPLMAPLLRDVVIAINDFPLLNWIDTQHRLLRNLSQLAPSDFPECTHQSDWLIETSRSRS